MKRPEKFIKLDQFLKWQGIAGTGGQAKQLILDGQVKVNGQVETRRGRKLADGDTVTIDDRTFAVRLSKRGSVRSLRVG